MIKLTRWGHSRWGDEQDAQFSGSPRVVPLGEKGGPQHEVGAVSTRKSSFGKAEIEVLGLSQEGWPDVTSA